MSITSVFFWCQFSWNIFLDPVTFSVLFNHVQLFVTPWTAACHASLSFTISQSLLKLTSIELVLPSNHLVFCCPLFLPSVFPSIRVFSSESALHAGGQSIGASASAPVIPMNIQGWVPLGLTGLISSLSKGLSRVLSSRVWKHQFCCAQPLWSNSHICIRLLEKPKLWLCGLCGQSMSLLFNMLSRFVIAFLPRKKHLLISWLQSPSTVTVGA